MRQVLLFVVLWIAVGCGGSNETCSATPSNRLDRGDGTTVVTCGTSKELVCTKPDCSGIDGVVLSNTDLTSVSLPTYSGSGAVRIVWNAALRSVSLPALVSAPELSVGSNPALTSLAVPQLAALTGSGADAMTSGLVGGGLIVTSNTALASLSLPALAMAGSLEVSDNDSLASVDLPALARVSGDCTPRFNYRCIGLDVMRNPALRSLNLPALATVSGELSISSNSGLQALNLPALRSLGSLSILDNAALSACQALSLFAHLRDAGFAGVVSISRNGSSATCNSSATTRMCQGIDVRTSQDWTDLAESGCTRMVGDLSFTSTTVTELPANTILQTIDGMLGLSFNSALKSLSLPALTTAHDLRVEGSSALTNVSLPALATTHTFSFGSNSALTSISAPLLRSVNESFGITDNTAYPQCAAQSILAHLTTQPKYVYISGNNMTATCP